MSHWKGATSRKPAATAPGGLKSILVGNVLRTKARGERAQALNPYRKRRQKLADARAEDAMPPGTCLKCGYPGPHPNEAACIHALRDRLSKFE